MDRKTQYGSMPLALLAAIVGVGISTLLFGAVLTSQNTVRFDRDFTTAFQGADAGVQTALSRVRALEAHGAEVAPDGPDGDFDGSAQTASVDYKYHADKVGHVWHIWSEGSVEGNPARNVEAEITQESLFKLAAFGKTLVGFKGGNGAASYNATSVDNGKGTVGTNGEIELNGNSNQDEVDRLVLFGEFAACTKTQSNCDAMYANDQVDGEDDPYVPYTGFIEDALDAAWCQASIRAYRSSVDGPLTGGAGPGPAGEYCFSTMTFDHGTATDLPILGIEDAVIYVSEHITSQNSSVVNCAACELLPNNPSDADIRAMLASDPPSARRLQIHSIGTNVSLGNHTHLSAGIYAPNASCHGNPSNAQGYIYGSMVCNDINNQGGWQFWYDEDLENVESPLWDISSIREEFRGFPSP